MTGDGQLTGTTVIVAPEAGMVAGVDVRGGGPGTRETDLLAPTASVERITAITLTGGSAYGLAAADGVMAALADRGLGLQVGPEPGQVVPLVPTAVLFDLGRGGTFRSTPGPQAGMLAVAAAFADPVGPVDGCRGAGTGAVVAGLKGGVGSASIVLPDGTTIAALVVVNAIGSPVDLRTGELLAGRLLAPVDADELRRPSAAELAALLPAATPRHPRTGAPLGGDRAAAAEAAAVQNTTIGVIATDVALTKGQCTKLAGVGHDGLARSLEPVHAMFDGDTLFGLSTATRPAPDPFAYHDILCAAPTVVARAVARAVLAARPVSTPGGSWPTYPDLVPGIRRTS
jgi:putative pantetheine hydrolase